MKMLPDSVTNFFHQQRYCIVSSISENGYPHNSCKGIVEIDKDGRIFLLDLYLGKTYRNLRRNPCLSITAVDEHRFIGYCLQGKATIIKREMIDSEMMRKWEKKIASRITHRLLKNIQGEKGHKAHPEAMLPKPAYLISVEVENIISLSPQSYTY